MQGCHLRRKYITRRDGKILSVTRTVFALYLSVALGAASLAWGFYAAGWDSLAAWILLGGAAWMLAVQQNQDSASSVGLILAVLTAGFGLFLKLHPGWMFAGGLFALFAWDLTEFRARTRPVVKDDDFRQAEHSHLWRVALLLLIGLALASLVMLLVRARFTMEWLALLALALLAALGERANWKRGEEAEGRR